MRRLAVLTLLSASCASVENRLVYHPTPASQPERPAPPPSRDMTLSLPDKTPIHARWCPHPQARRVLLYCHGNGGNVEGRGGAVYDLWHKLAASVLIFDYPGYGKSGGKPSEAGCYASAQAAYDWLLKEQRIPPGQIVLVGESLGGGVAVELASRNEHAALVLVRTFTSLPDVAGTHYPWFPAGLSMVNRFDNLSRLPNCRRPVFIAQADKDTIIPVAHGARLKEACRTPAELHTLTGLGHNEPLPDSFYSALERFLASH